MRNLLVSLLGLGCVVLVACGDNNDNPQNPVCGDGKVDTGETCDDGNAVSGDGCDMNCTATACGNGVMTTGEGCDDGNTTDGDGCDNNCMVTGCGNGVVSTGETCDDGNTVSGDGCDNNCTTTACGNGVMTTGEGCDDGNAVNGDGCDSNCTMSGCGNGVMAGTEECDDGNTTAFDGCSAACLTETLEKEPNEDGAISTGATGITGNDFATANADANGAYGAGTIIAKLDPAGDEDVFKFSNTGTVAVLAKFDTWNLETGFGIGVSCATSIDTGINIKDAAGGAFTSNDNRTSSDHCSSASIALLPGDSVYVHVVALGDNTATGYYALQATYTAATCGDGMLGAGEECDDTNTTDGDGCSAMCDIEGAVAEVEPNEDGTPSAGGGTTTGNDFATANADANGAITTSTFITASIRPTGDEDVFAITNNTTGPETLRLDTWNLAPGFGVGVTCGTSAVTSIDTVIQIRNAAGTSLASNDDRNGGSDWCAGISFDLAAGQTVYAQVFSRSDNKPLMSYGLQIALIPVVCGDGMTGVGEQCDDGNTTNGDGCSSTCQIEIICGDGTVGGTEQCDDGNTTSGDGCSSTCQIEVVCGDTMVGPGEQCDDGNTTNGDGCSSTCQIEGAVSEIEPNEDGTPSTGGSGINGNDFAIANADTNGAFTGNVVITAALSPVGDEDVFKFTNPTATTVQAKFDIWNLAPGFGIGKACGTSIDTALHVRNAAGTSLASNDDRNGAADRCSTLTFAIAAGGTVYVHVSAYDDATAIASYALNVVYTPVVCGDGAVGPGETCDDGNTTPGDGCSATCQLEVVCGDGVRGGTEQCDDGNTISGDGCNATCQVETTTEVEPNGTPTDATASTVQITGDKVIQGAITPVADKDVYQVVVATGTVVRFETLTSFYDCASGTTIDIRLLDMGGTQIIADTAGLGIGSCGAISMYLPAGTYFIQVEERGNNALVANYFLQVDFDGDTGTETEPNDTQAQANTNVSTLNNVFVFGDHVLNTDSDVYAITVPPGGRIRAEIVEGDRPTETCEGNSIDSRLTLYNQAFTQLVDDDDDGRGFCSLIDGSGTTPLDVNAKNATGTTQIYYLQVRASSFSQTGIDGQFVYRLQVTIR
jgi:cysteine-rich repeat protein